MKPRASLLALAAVALAAGPAGMAALAGPVAPRRPSPPLSPTDADLERLLAAERKRARRAAQRLRGLL